MWSLYYGDKFLKPLQFSNGKTQEDTVNEVLKLIEEGNRIIFIHGVCGTGKSAIALNIARELGKSCIVVPGKTLQNQYKEDYENQKYLLKENGERLKISVITGRNNHKCRYLEDKNVPIFREERNLKLNEIFDRREKETNLTADNPFIPCKIELKEKNSNRIFALLKENHNVNPKNFNTVKDVKFFFEELATQHGIPASTHHGLDLLLGFEDATPNNTLSALWASSSSWAKLLTR